MKKDIYNLNRFITAQDRVYEQVLNELSHGEKVSHWMWFIFPQISGLGQSPVAVEFSIKSRAEAEAYLQHDILGNRLRECTQKVLAVNGKTAMEIFWYPDVLKFHSSMTLFLEISGDTLFLKALEKFYKGEKDQLTLQKLKNLKY